MAEVETPHLVLRNSHLVLPLTPQNVVKNAEFTPQNVGEMGKFTSQNVGKCAEFTP